MGPLRLTEWAREARSIYGKNLRLYSARSASLSAWPSTSSNLAPSSSLSALHALSKPPSPHPAYKPGSPCLCSYSVWNAIYPLNSQAGPQLSICTSIPGGQGGTPFHVYATPDPGSASISQQGAVGRAQNVRLVSSGNLFQMLALPLTSCRTLDTLTSVYFDFLLRKMETKGHLLYWLLGESTPWLYVKHLEECLAWGKSCGSLHHSCCSLSLISLLSLSVCRKEKSGERRETVPCS